VQRLRVLVRAPEDRADRLRRQIQRLLAFRFGRLEHQRFVHDQREIHRRRVHARVYHGLRNVHCGNARFFFELFEREHEFVHAAALRRGPARRF
jgi:hypothetical protein